MKARQMDILFRKFSMAICILFISTVNKINVFLLAKSLSEPLSRRTKLSSFERKRKRKEKETLFVTKHNDITTLHS